MEVFESFDVSALIHPSAARLFSLEWETRLTTSRGSMKHLSIGMDGGHSMFKIRAGFLDTPADRVSLQIPTAVMPAIRLGNDRAQQQAVADTVVVGGTSYFVGNTALRQGQLESFTGQNSNWVTTPEHDALIVAAWNRTIAVVGKAPMRISLVLGLPAKYYSSQKAALRERVAKLVTPLLATGQVLKVLVQNQGEAPLQWLALNPDGTPNATRDLDSQMWGVIEIGHFTTDFSLSDRGTMIERVSTSCEGMQVVYDAVAKELASHDLPTNVEAVELAVRNRAIATPTEVIDLAPSVKKGESVFTAAVVDHAVRVFDKQKRMLQGIVVAGGGAPVLFDTLKSKFAQCLTDKEPRFVVAEGLCRVGLLGLRYQSAQ